VYNEFYASDEGEDEEDADVPEQVSEGDVDEEAGTPEEAPQETPVENATANKTAELRGALLKQQKPKTEAPKQEEPAPASAEKPTTEAKRKQLHESKPGAMF